MANALLAGVANVDLFDQTDNKLIVSTKTLTDSGLNMAVNAEEARGGQGNKLLGKYYHDSSFGLTLTDQIYNMEYLKLNCGGGITASSDVIANEQVVVEVANQITVKQNPKAFTQKSGVIGWYKKSTEADDAYKVFTFDDNAKTATINGLTVGDVVCIKYVITDSSARKFVVNANYIPSVVHAIMTIPLFKAGTTKEALSSSSKIGQLIVDIPNFQLEGSQDLGLNSSGIASMSLSGSALATFEGNDSCENDGYYAVITEQIFGADEFANVSAIVVANSDMDLTVGDEEVLKVYKMYNDGTQPSLVDNAKLTFTKEGTSASVDTATGKVTADRTGSTASDKITTIEINVTSKTELSAQAVVTVE